MKNPSTNLRLLSTTPNLKGGIRQSRLAIKSGLKAGGQVWNHNQTQQKPRLTVKSGMKAGGCRVNHNQTQQKPRLAIKSGLKAGVGGWIKSNHNQTQRRAR